MGYVDLQRREEQSRGKREQADPHRSFGPYFSVAVGFVLGVLASQTVLSASEGYASFLVHVALLSLFLAGVWRLGRAGSEVARPRFGVEKQLLLAIRDAGCGVTPVEAALLTSLTVDEAEEILTRFAGRGHLLVESRDGVLFYVLPGGREGPVESGRRPR